ncbi:MAG: XdhC family protein [Spirochaetia bacterium]
MQDIRSELLTWVKDERTPIALATVIELEGSGLRKPGATLAVAADGEIIGSISGGCVEPQVLEKAEALIRDETGSKQSTLIRLEADDDPLHNPLSPCSTALEIALCLLDTEVLEHVAKACAGRSPFVWGIVLATESSSASDLDRSRDIDTHILFGYHPETHEVYGQAARQEQLFLGPEWRAKLNELKLPTIFSLAGRRIFACPVPPRPRLVIIGASHIAQHLAAFAITLDYEVLVGDPRERFLSRERFPESVALHSGRVDRLLHAMALDHTTAVAVVSHDDKIDDVAVAVAVNSPAFYIGALGSSTTQKARRKRLVADGLSTGALDRIHGPIGLGIKAREPAEIAVAILAEIVATYRAESHDAR